MLFINSIVDKRCSTWFIVRRKLELFVVLNTAGPNVKDSRYLSDMKRLMFLGMVTFILRNTGYRKNNIFFWHEVTFTKTHMLLLRLIVLMVCIANLLCLHAFHL